MSGDAQPAPEHRGGGRGSVRAWRRHPKKLAALAILAIGLPLTHEAIALGTRMHPADVAVTADHPVERDGIQRLGTSYARMRAGVRELYLAGDPEQIGATQARLNYDHMVRNERALWGDFAHYVPFWPARALMMDLSRVRYRHLDQGFAEPRRREISAEARAFDPDPFASHLPTYQRMVFLHSLYDIALSFEHSPLIGCSTFGLGPGATKDGHSLFARAFDFEAGDVFDRDKAVYFVRGDGLIPFASVAWPGLIGVMSGMNLEGVAVVVHGARARTPLTEGEPVVFMLRDVLEHAHDTNEAISILKSQSVMVSHIVIVADSHGHFASVERAPGVPAFIHDDWKDPDRIGITNHFEGPLADDPKNLAVRANTTTLPRRARLDELLAGVGPHEADVPSAIAMLRDHQCAGGALCELGDRRAIDALIATHGIVADTTDKVLWVSAGPHLSGHFVRFDLKVELSPQHDPSTDGDPEIVADDPILHDGRYEAGRARAGAPKLAGDAPGGKP
jgi:isopenicillin-N N-acyltransferase like protein